MRRWSTPLVIRETQGETTVTYSCTPSRMAKVKVPTIPTSARDEAELLGPSVMAPGNARRHCLFRKHVYSFFHS